MSRTVYVYALCDPQTLQIKYVGKTLNANGRYDAHCRDEKNTGKLEWIKELAELDLKPVMHVICEVDEAHADQVERALIQAYATEKQPLVNLALMPKYPASVFGEPLKTGYEAMSEEEQKQSIDEYPDPISLDDAADLAARFMPDLYPDKRKARNSIRTASYRGAIPGAWRRDDSPNGWDIWRYDKTLLVSWLSGDLKWMPATKKQNRGAPTLPATLIPPGAWH